MSKEKTVTARLRVLDPKLIYALVLLVIAAPILHPIGLPVPISATTKALYDVIEALPTGSIVWYGIDLDMSAISELFPGFVATTRHLFSRGARIMFVSFVPEGLMLFGKALAEAIPPQKIYGQDYVYMGFYPGGETAIASLAANVRETAKTDYLGKPIDELPLLKDIKTAKDFALVITAVGLSTIIDAYIRQVVTPYGVKFAVLPAGALYPEKMVYYPKQIVGMLNSQKGAAEYEKLLGFVGAASSTMDAFTTAQLLLIALVLIVNIAYFTEKVRRGGRV